MPSDVAGSWKSFLSRGRYPSSHPSTRPFENLPRNSSATPASQREARVEHSTSRSIMPSAPKTRTRTDSGSSTRTPLRPSTRYSALVMPPVMEVTVSSEILSSSEGTSLSRRSARRTRTAARATEMEEVASTLTLGRYGRPSTVTWNGTCSVRGRAAAAGAERAEA